MGAANGFITTRPDTRYGDTESSFLNTETFGAKYTAPGSGTLTITEIGLYTYNAGGGACVLGIFSHDASNDCPEDLVTNSQTDALSYAASMEILYFSYSTCPTVTGGQVYWICSTHNNNNKISRFATGGNNLYVTSMTYPTWPTATQWETHSDQTRDMSFYAVYTTSAGTSVVPQIAQFYRNLRND